jgi:hypothetical protein
MGYYAADKNGYLEDIASIGGMKAMRKWSKTQVAVIRNLFEHGSTHQVKEVAEALLVAHVEGEVASTVRNLARVAAQAEELLILSDGNNDAL